MNAVARVEYKPLYREVKQSAGMVRLGWGQAGTRGEVGSSEDSAEQVSAVLGAVTQVTSQSWGLDNTCPREDQALAPWVPKI